MHMEKREAWRTKFSGERKICFLSEAEYFKSVCVCARVCVYVCVRAHTRTHTHCMQIKYNKFKKKLS